MNGPREREQEARKVGHPDPENATWGEVNILSIAYMRNGNERLSTAQAERILHIAEFDADFYD